MSERAPKELRERTARFLRTLADGIEHGSTLRACSINDGVEKTHWEIETPMGSVRADTGPMGFTAEIVRQ